MYTSWSLFLKHPRHHLLQIPSETSDHIGESIIIGELRGFPLESKYFFVDKETLSTSKNQLSFHSLSTFWETCIPINERGSFSTHVCPNDQPVGLRDTVKTPESYRLKYLYKLQA